MVENNITKPYVMVDSACNILSIDPGYVKLGYCILIDKELAEHNTIQLRDKK